MSVLQFTPFASTLSPEFWTTFSKLKVDELKLSDAPVPLVGRYGGGKSVRDRETGQLLSLGTALHFDSDAFAAGNQGATVSSTSSASSSSDACEIHGTLLNFNTIEAFKSANKPALFKRTADELWRVVAESDEPTAGELNTTLVIAFAELKKYAFYYWFAFPAFISKPAWTLSSPWQSATQAYPAEEAQAIAKAYADHVADKGRHESHACLLRHSSENHSIYQTARLSDATAFFANVPDDERILLFVDPSSDPQAAGWPLRNMLAHLALKHRILTLRIICMRADMAQSLAGTIALDSAEAYTHNRDNEPAVAVGWEKNQAGKLAPRMADLGGVMDPRRLADQAVDLNLKLMRWRILPSLDLEKIQRTKCLLLGAGTLGCYVSRGLMAWGVRKITLVDSGRVSYSNPVRQPLFEFADCFEGGKPKAACAAAALKRIYPSVDAVGLQMAIPMPGHPVPPALVEETKLAIQQLDELIDAHDVVFLLMDSRESRWLPTMLGAAKGKLVMNAALGFDNYVVARHGMLAQPIERRLGCYYCTDIVAPTDSLSDRTLDQMCTVTRPGLAAIASATAVELLTAVLQHKDGPSAPSECEKRPDAAWGSVLGAVPHTIRGFLSDFNTLKITGQAYINCTACSEKVVDAYRKDGFDMLLKAFEDAKYLEQITGLDKLHAETEAALEAVDWDEEDDF